MSSLEDLAQVRSQVALGLRAYLTAVSSLHLKGWRFVGLTVPTEGIYQWPCVRPFEKKPSPDSSIVWFGGGDPKTGTPQAWLDRRRILVVGEPGAGKTALTWMTARVLAQRALTIWDERSVPLAHLGVPLWISLVDALREGSVRNAISKVVSRQVAEVLVSGDLPTAALTAAPTAAFLSAALDRPGTTLFLDAPPEALDSGDDALEALADLRSLRCQVIVVGRPSPAMLARLSPHATVFELELLTSGQRTDFVSRWLQVNGQPAEGATAILALAQEYPSVAELTANPLHLTNFCATALHLKKDELANLDPVHLYNGAVRRMLGTPELTQRLWLISFATAKLFDEPPSFPTFADTSWDRALQHAGKACGVSDEIRGSVVSGDHGLVVGESAEEGQDRKRFVHADFYYYLAAVAFIDERELYFDEHRSERDLATLLRHRSGERWHRLANLASRYARLIGRDPAASAAIQKALQARSPATRRRWTQVAAVLLAAVVVAGGMWLVLLHRSSGPTRLQDGAVAQDQSTRLRGGPSSQVVVAREPSPVGTYSRVVARGRSATSQPIVTAPVASLFVWTITRKPTERPEGGGDLESIEGTVTASAGDVSGSCVVAYAKTTGRTWHVQPEVRSDVCKAVGPKGSWSLETRGGAMYLVVLMKSGGTPPGDSYDPGRATGVLGSHLIDFK